ncbi:diguanylate cyclase (GGDEF)-like protein [Jatrophihabitans sp. GAS493]|uniref:putative bifunctional diguanylate cyclase/phosphodiesterase n=1 Tax=Jatrophihabitans sp. GAS493 TaxID=1907575 RepID=UPI000BB67948|nr:GGDEF domain-containing phosphodiesterase [Jatrophihabitans sp. GAS493]SOD72658.1 diguanylate cyclase (GGDEF)-like protein [Jatrophihabitans sp. GAS493]
MHEVSGSAPVAATHAVTLRAVLRYRLRVIWAAAQRKPAVGGVRIIASTTGLAFIIAGVFGICGLYLQPVPLPNTTLLTAVAVVTIISGIVTIAVGHRIPHIAFHPLLVSATVIITVAVCMVGPDDQVSALDDAIMFMLVVLGASFYFPWGAALAHIALVEACSAFAFHYSGLIEAQVLYLQGCLVILAFAVVWLTRAAAAAERDPLTGLYSRLGFELRLTQAIADAQRNESPLAVVVMDLDDFKSVNDLAGHSEGDRLLSALAAIWKPMVSRSKVLCRQGGDEFALILPGYTANRAAGLADSLRAAVLHEASFSAGVAELRPDDSQSKLLGRADVALYNAKSGGGGQTSQFGVVDDASAAAQLYRALQDGQFEVYFQPIVDLKRGAVTGDEALIRWNHPERGMVAPGEFIQLAETSGAIHVLGRWMLREACARTAAHIRETGVPRSISVNASGHELTNPEYGDYVAQALAEADLDPSALIIEVTESTFDADHLRVLAVLRDLRELGVRIAIDDFGTGYSSLNRLENLPANVLKVDQSFVAAIPEQGGEMPVLRAIVAMAMALDLKIVAEGVETARQARVLTELGCSHAQGYFFGRPAPQHQDAPLNPVPSTSMKQVSSEAWLISQIVA